MDLDQSGNFSQRISVFQGPTLGRVDVQVLPQIMVRSPGTTILGIGTSVVLVDVAGLVTINLPDVTQVIKVLPFLQWGQKFCSRTVSCQLRKSLQLSPE
jgi:hypothetical protein